jgi:hypothetical protein
MGSSTVGMGNMGMGNGSTTTAHSINLAPTHTLQSTPYASISKPHTHPDKQPKNPKNPKNPSYLEREVMRKARAATRYIHIQ